VTATNPDRYFELIEQRIALLSSLADALTAARLDMVSFDITGLEQRISEQDHLCTRIRDVDSELDRVQRHCAAVLAIGAPAAGIPVRDTQRLRDLATRLNAVQSTVKQLNLAHQMLLRRSRRTASALLSSYQSFAETYSDPSAARVCVGERA
jgi:hypothetical protein